MSLQKFGTVKYHPSLKLRAAAELELRRRAAPVGGGVQLSVAEFIDRYVIIDDAQGDDAGVMPFKLWDAQREMLTTFQNERLLIILKSRQLGLSWLACAYALHLCLFKSSRLVLTFSIGQEEANEMMRRITAMYDRLPEGLKKTLPNVRKRNTEEFTLDNGSSLHALPSRKSAGSGYTASLIILDEFAKNENAAALYTAVKPTIDGGGQMLILSTANGAGNLFHTFVERARAGDGRFAFRFLPWQVRPGRDAAWYAAVEADAVDSSLMRQEYPATPEEAFEATEVGAFLPSIALWDACKEDLPPLDAHTPYVLALDAAESNDTFASMLVSMWGERVAPRYVRPYVPIPGVPLDFNEIEIDLRELVRAYAVTELAYDPFLLGQLIMRLQKPATLYRAADTERARPLYFPALGAPCVPFHQGPDRLVSDKGLYDLITTRKLAHDGNGELRAHIANANRKLDSEGRKMRIVKRTYALKIDLAVALSMGAARILSLPFVGIPEAAKKPNRWGAQPSGNRWKQG